VTVFAAAQASGLACVFGGLTFARVIASTATAAASAATAAAPAVAAATPARSLHRADAHPDPVAEAEAMAEQHLARQDEVRRVATLVRWLDDLVRVPGTRFGFGLDAILGLFVPVIGDLVTGAAAVAVITAAQRRGVPRVVVLRMLVNLGVDTLVGMVPVAGDAFDLLWRANVRNLELLERHQGELEPKARPSDYAVVAAAVGMVGLGVAAPILLLVWLIGLVTSMGG
jgi:hypothetical protein